MKRLAMTLFALAFSSAAWAQQKPELDVTMQVVPPGGTPGAVTGPITLPEHTPTEAKENSAFGLDTANRARELGREFGQSVSGAASSATERPHFTLPKPPGK